ncbi:flavin-containing amine oxidase [Theileria orientalis]|uniref:Flavin-containing amine oxidase n=1 Tax=Theileria orientalis TaxID=68886 RepID=A0A976M479_THEOR|nr:flavin-containing amine oxidase [Theileria orientalis]
MNEDEKYKWLFLYISLTDRQREELHGSLPSTSCNIGAYSEEVTNVELNNDFSKESAHIRSERPLKRSRKELDSGSSNNLESSSNENGRGLKRHNRGSEVKNEEKVNRRANTENVNSPISGRKATKNDANTHQYTLNSSDSLGTETDLNNQNLESEFNNCPTQETTYPRNLNWSKINEKVAMSNYDRYISSSNILTVLKRLRSRFEVDYIYPIWNKAGVSMKLRMRVILASPSADTGREEDYEYREYEDVEEDRPDGFPSKYDLKSREPVKSDEYLHLRRELEVLDDPQKREWIRKLLNCRFLEVSFLIRDGGINAAYRSAIDLRNYFYSFMNRRLSKNNIIILTDDRVDTGRFKYDQPRYFKSKDEIHMTNAIRLLKLVNILQTKFHKNSIIARNKHRMVMLNSSYEDLTPGDPTKNPIRKVVVRSVKSITTGLSPRLKSNPKRKQRTRQIRQKAQDKKPTKTRSLPKKAWDMERLRMCIIDPPPLPEYYTFSEKSENKRTISSKILKKNYELVNNSNNNNVDEHTSVGKKNVTSNTMEIGGNIETNTKDTREGNYVNGSMSTTEDNTQIHASTLDTLNKIMATTQDIDTDTTVTALNKNTATTNNVKTHNKVTTQKISGVNENEAYDYKDFCEIEDNEKFDVIIIGAGVGGLGAASYLRKRNLKVGVVEARNRIGGRMLTTYFPKITVSHDHEDNEYDHCASKHEGKYEVKRHGSRCHEDCVNLPEMSIDLGPNYLHCNNVFFSSNKAETMYDSNASGINSGGGIGRGASPNNNANDINEVEQNPKEDADRRNHMVTSDTVELYEKNMLFNPYKDVRNKRGMDKSILGLASMLKPFVGDISGFSNWEPTLYTNWYNEQTGKKINFLSVVKVNTVVDHMLQRTSKVFNKLTHEFFTDYRYADKPIAIEGVNGNLEEGEVKELVNIDTNGVGTSNMNNSDNDLTIVKKETGNSPDFNDMTTTTTAMEDDHFHFNNNYSSSSSGASDAGHDTCNDLIDSNKISGTECVVYNSVKVEDYENKGKKEEENEQDIEYEDEEQYDEQDEQEGEETKMAVDSDYSPENKKVKIQYDSDKANTGNEVTQQTAGLRKSTRIKKLSSFILYNENLNKPSVGRNKRKVGRKEFFNQESIRGREKSIIWSKIKIKGMEELLKRGKEKLLSLWDIYIAIYVELLEEVKKQLKYGLTGTEEKLLYAIMQSRLGYNSDMRETCISMCKLPASFSPLYLKFESANEEENESEKAESSVKGDVTVGNSIDDGATVGVICASTGSTTAVTRNTGEATICTIEASNDLDINPFRMNERTLNTYVKHIRKQFDRYTKLNISRFDGKSDSDKLVINGWGWLLNHLTKNIKANIYLNTKLMNITILEVNTTQKANGVKNDEEISESSKDNEDFGDYNIKLTLKYNRDSTTRFNRVNWDAEITNFTDYTLYNYGDDDDPAVDFHNNVDGGTALDTGGNTGIETAGSTAGDSASEFVRKLEHSSLHNCKKTDSKVKEDDESSSNMSKILEGEKQRVQKHVELGKLEKYVDIANLLQPHEQQNQQYQHRQGLGNLKVEQDEIKRIYAKYVLITVPNSLVGEIEFEPKLDENKIKSLKNYDMGYHNKIIMRFKPCEVFWPKHELQFNCLDSSFQFMNLDAYGKKGCLLAHSFPPFSKCFIKVTKEALLMRCLELLHRMFNLEKKVYPVQVFITNWKSDPFARGSYSYPTKYARDEDIIHLKSPHPIGNPKVLFSGEYISNSYYQCVDGSYDTSIRAAEDIYNLGLFNSTSSSGSNSNDHNTSNSNYNNNSAKSGIASGIRKKSIKYSRSSNRDLESDKRAKYLDNILNNDHADSFMGIPIPLPSKDLLGFYLTDGSDELFSDDNDFITLPTNLGRNEHQLNEISKLNREKRTLRTREEPSLFDCDYDDCYDTEAESSRTRKRKVLDENYTCINTTESTDNTNSNTSDNTDGNTNNNSTGGTTNNGHVPDNESKELEMLLIIKSVLSEDEIHIGSLLESYQKFKEILIHLLQEQYVNKHIHYSNVIMISLLTTTLQYIKSNHQRRHEDDAKAGDEDEEEKYESGKDEKNGFDKLNKKVLSDLGNHKDERVQIRNQQFSRKMIRNMSKLLGLRHDFLCHHCLRGGEVILCDTEGCDLVWHYDCLPSAFRPKTGCNLNDVKPETCSTPSKDESSTWKCPICLNFPIKVGGKGEKRVVAEMCSYTGFEEDIGGE